MAEHDSDPSQYFHGPGRKRAYDVGPSGGFDDGFKKRKMEEVDFSDDPDDPPATLRILVRNQAAGGIIGKGGDNIKRLRKQYDCQVLLPDSPGSPERVMTMMGTIDSCVGVLGDVLPQLGEGLMREGGDEQMMLEVQVLIPQPFMGTIIGTGGTKIKELRTRTRTNIKIFSDPMPNSNERSIQLMGTRDQLLECAQYFLDEISKKEPREPIMLYEPMPMDPGFGGGGGEEAFPPRGGGRGRGPRGGFRGRGGPGRGGSFHSDVPINQWSSPQGGRGGRGGGRGGRGRGGAVPGMKPESPVHGSTWNPPPLVQSRGYGGSPGQPAPQPPPPQFTSPAPPSQAHNAPPTRPPMAPYPPPAAGHNVGYGMNPPNVGYTGSQPNNVQPPTHMPPRAAVPLQPYVPRPAVMGQQAPPTQYRPPPSHQPSAPPTSQQPVGQMTQQVTIPLQYTDAIVGKNGANLQHIRAQSSCEIHVEELRPGATERLITITGTPNGIQFAQQLMQNSVRQYHHV